jgi:alpha-1,2-mannosyltransferase
MTPLGPSKARRALTTFGIAVVLLGAGTTLTQNRSVSAEPSDLEINWVAAQRLVDGRPLYDRAAARAQAVVDFGRGVGTPYTHTFTDYVGTPVVAFLHVPLLAFGFGSATVIARLVAVLGMLAAVALTTLALGRSARVPAALVGLGGLLLSAGAVRALDLGQAQGVVTAGLAVGVWGTARKRWALAGVGLGVASVLKLSPALLVLYLALRREWRAVRWAAATAAALSACAAAIGRPDDLAVWVRHVAPTVSQGTRVIWNQSLPAWFARMFSHHPDVTAYAPIGAWRLLGVAVALAATIGLWWARRRCAIAPLDLGILVLVALLAGPLSWDHYLVWALIPLVLVFDPERWAGRSPGEATALLGALAIGTLLLYLPTNALWVLTLHDGAWSQLRSGPYTLAVLLYLAVAGRLVLVPLPERADQHRPTIAASGSTR